MGFPDVDFALATDPVVCRFTARVLKSDGCEHEVYVHIRPPFWIPKLVNGKMIINGLDFGGALSS